MLVAAIALVIALGTGTYAGLLGTSAWRTQPNDASFAVFNTHDLRIALPLTGELVGTDAHAGAPVDGVWISSGRPLGVADDGQPRVVVESVFARRNNLPIPAEITVSGGARLTVVARGRSPRSTSSSPAARLVAHRFSARNRTACCSPTCTPFSGLPEPAERSTTWC